MGGKLTSGGIKLPETGDVEQSKVVISVDGKEADETGNIDLGGAFDFVNKKTQIRGCKALTWNQLRVQGLDDWERHRGSDLGMDEESLTVSSLTGEYVYIAEVDSENKSSAYYRSDNGGATYSRHIVPTEGVDVKLIRTSETGQVVLLSTHIGGVFISKDYGKTWEIPITLSTSNSKSSWFISMSSNGQNLIFPNFSGNLYLEMPKKLSGFIRHLLVLPYGVDPNSIKEFFLSNDTDRDNIRMVILTRSGNVYVSRNGGEQWSNEGSGFAGIYVDKEITNIYSIKQTSVYIMPINGNGFTSIQDFKQYPKYQNLTKDPNTFQLRSIFVSRDYKTGEDKIAVFTINGDDNDSSADNSNYGSSSSEDPDNSEEILTNPNKEKPFTGILISEDSGNTWDLSQIKFTLGGATPYFRHPSLDGAVGYPRLQLIENFESGLFIFTNPLTYSKINNIVRISDKSTSYTSSSKVILDGSITLGMSMEADTEYFNKMPGTIEYANMFDGYHFNFDDSTWIFQEGGSDRYTPSDETFKPLAIVGTSPSEYGRPVKSIKVCNTLEGMEKLESRNIEMSSYKDTTNPAKILEMYQGEIRPTSIETSDLSNKECYIYTDSSTPMDGFRYTENSSEVLIQPEDSNLRWFDDTFGISDGFNGHASDFIYDEQNSQVIRVGGSYHNIFPYTNGGIPRPHNVGSNNNNVVLSVEFWPEDKDHYKILNGITLSSQDSIRLGEADFFKNGQTPESARLPTTGTNQYGGAGFGKKMLIYNNNLYIFGGQGHYASWGFTDRKGFGFGKIDLSNNTYSTLSHPEDVRYIYSTKNTPIAEYEEFVYPVAFFEYSGDLYVLVDNHDEVYFELYKYTISTDTWSGPKAIYPGAGLGNLYYSGGSSDWDSDSVASVTTLNVNDDIYIIEHGGRDSTSINIGICPKSSLVDIFNTGVQSFEGSFKGIGTIPKNLPTITNGTNSIYAPAVCFDGVDNIIIHGGYRTDSYHDDIYHLGDIWKFSISERTSTKIETPPIYETTWWPVPTPPVNPQPSTRTGWWPNQIRRSYHNLLVIQGCLYIVGGYYNSDPTGFYGFTEVVDGYYLTNDKGDTVTSKIKTLHLHEKLESSDHCDYTSLLVNENFKTLTSDITNLKSTLTSRIENLEKLHVRMEVLSSPSSEGYYIDNESQYAIFYYAGNYQFKFISETSSVKNIVAGVSMLGGGGGGAGGYQGDQWLGGCGTPQNGNPGGSTIISQPRSITIPGGSGGTPVHTGYPGGSTRRATMGSYGYSGVSLIVNTPYTWTVGAGGSGGKGSGSLGDRNGVGGAGGAGGAGGTTGPGSNGGSGGNDGGNDAFGGAGGSGGGTQGTGTNLISIENVRRKNMTGFGEPGMNGGGGSQACSHSDSGGGGGGGGGANGYIIIEW